ncbi:phosphoglycerate kinase [Neisseriaceae bacterium PsAf]|nr:phosphoglycerate kinase [Neisseriaceae bacterium PsAf]
MQYNTIKDFKLNDKTVLIRVDMNVPLKDGVITDDTRIKASLLSVEYALNNGASVILMTHLGRPKEGEYSEQDDVTPIANKVSELLGRKVQVVDNWQTEGIDLKPGEVIMLQNVRFNKGEKKDSDELGKAYACLCDIFVNDAFGTAHRAQASTHAVAKFAPEVACGLLLDSELKNLEKALSNPQKPIVAIVGGSKVSTKLKVLDKLADFVDNLIVGGGIANTFLLAKGYKVGNSLVEASLVGDALNIINKIESRGGHVPLPSDVYVAKEFSDSAQATLKNIADLDEDDQILDFGPETMSQLSKIVDDANTIVWNGPLGVFEFENFAQGTKQLAEAIAKSKAFSIAGGGDTLAAVSQFGVTDDIDYVSTGGGAFLEFLEGEVLPAVGILLK